MTPETDDEFLWLEEIDSPQVNAWIDDRNAETAAKLQDERFEAVRDKVRAVLDDERRIPYPNVRGAYLYDLWTDADHPRGLWRRTTWDSYRSADPDWDTLIDIDALGRQEGVNWVWGGVVDLAPYERFLVKLSRGGSDAAVLREFDVETRTFVDGFTLPEAKTGVAWLDRDTVFVMTDFGPESLTDSGYARIVKLWKRGTDISEAETVFEGQKDDVVVSVTTSKIPGYERAFVHRWFDFISRESWERKDDGTLVPVDVPADATWETHGEWLILLLRQDWLGHAAGSLLVTPYLSFMDGGREFEVLFQPSANSALNGWSWTQHHLIVDVMTDVQNRLEVWRPGAVWLSAPLVDAAPGMSTHVVDTSPDDNDEYLIASDGYLQPAVLRHGRSPARADEVLKEAPAFFDSTGMTVRQLFATSDDGTRIPYSVVGPDDGKPRPTMMFGYGGFRVPLLPDYDGAIGPSWLDRGGIFVEANIRGGGEYGPAWHEVARRDGRHLAYEDFAAVARDLVARGITTVSQLGAKGRSNGGLLMGVMLTRYPELFGALWIGVPLLDMRRFHKLLAGASWMNEYGNPDVAEDWDFISRYSPYQNVRAGAAYPPVLITTSTRDDRVHPGHARKMAALLGSLDYDVTYYENREGGHAGAADHEQEAFVTALATEFLWRQLDK